MIDAQVAGYLPLINPISTKMSFDLTPESVIHEAVRQTQRTTFNRNASSLACQTASSSSLPSSRCAYRVRRPNGTAICALAQASSIADVALATIS